MFVRNILGRTHPHKGGRGGSVGQGGAGGGSIKVPRSSTKLWMLCNASRGAQHRLSLRGSPSDENRQRETLSETTPPMGYAGHTTIRCSSPACYVHDTWYPGDVLEQGGGGGPQKRSVHKKLVQKIFVLQNLMFTRNNFSTKPAEGGAWGPSNQAQLCWSPDMRYPLVFAVDLELLGPRQIGLGGSHHLWLHAISVPDPLDQLPHLLLALFRFLNPAARGIAQVVCGGVRGTAPLPRGHYPEPDALQFGVVTHARTYMTAKSPSPDTAMKVPI